VVDIHIQHKLEYRKTHLTGEDIFNLDPLVVTKISLFFVIHNHISLLFSPLETLVSFPELVTSQLARRKNLQSGQRETIASEVIMQYPSSIKYSNNYWIDWSYQAKESGGEDRKTIGCREEERGLSEHTNPQVGVIACSKKGGAGSIDPQYTEASYRRWGTFFSRKLEKGIVIITMFSRSCEISLGGQLRNVRPSKVQPRRVWFQHLLKD